MSCQRFAFALILIWIMTGFLVGPAGAAEGPATSDVYQIGQNDVIRIQVFGEEDLTIEAKVAGDGTINYPLLGSVPVGGKTVKELQDYLAKRLAEGYVRSPRVTVLMVRYRNFYLTGEIRTPGAYAFESGMTIQKAVSMAGGFTEKAETRQVMVTRRSDKGAEPATLGLDAPVQPDDIIVVGQMQKFYVTGEVKTPGRFQYEPGLTVQKAVSMAGGLSEKGDPAGIKLTRLGESAVKTLPVGSEASVQPDDIIVVEGQVHKIYVSGEVRTPGGYPFKEGLNVQKVLAMAGGLTEKAEKSELKLVRQVNGREEIIPAMPTTHILPEDTIVVPEGQRFYVTGEVKAPGRYLFESGLTVQKALSMAGGMTEKGDPSSIRMTRLDDVAVKTLSVSADTMVEPDDIIVVDAQNKKFYVSGEVKLPGGYVYKDGLTVQKALVMAGGPSEKAEKSALKIVRQAEGREETMPATLATVIQPEDTIVVPEGQRFYVTGEVKAPGRYLFESGLTVQKALSMAGGLTEKADPAGVKMTRPKATSVEMAIVSPDAQVLPDDILIVEGQNHKFYVSGEVRTPGSYAYKEGLTVQKALAMAGGPSDKAEKGVLKIVRKADGREETLPATLATVVQAEDTIVVPEGQKFYVSGEVKTPGRYLFEPGLTVQKALSMAGGLTEKADKAEVKVNRLEDGIVRTLVLDAHTPILPNDVLVVAQAQKIFVEGEVKLPGSFPYERGMTVHMAIAMAGGFTDKASQGGTKILRNLNGQEQSERAKLDWPVQPNDIIVVPQRFF